MRMQRNWLGFIAFLRYQQKRGCIGGGRAMADKALMAYSGRCKCFAECFNKTQDQLLYEYERKSTDFIEISAF